MESIKTVLAAIDFSKYSEGALRLAAYMAESFQARLVVLTVVNQRDVAALKFVQNTTADLIKADEVVEQRKQYSLEKIDGFMQEAQCGQMSYDKKVRVGTPWEEIVKEAKESGAAMVVIGTKGKSNFEHALFGSNADKLYRHCPVTVVSARGDLHMDMVCKLRGYQNGE